MKKIIISILAFSVIAGIVACGGTGENAGTDIQPGTQSGADISTQTDPGNDDGRTQTAQRSDADTYWIYLGGDDWNNPGQVIVPNVFYDGQNYDYPEFLEMYRFAQYIVLHENGTGTLYTEDRPDPYETYEELKFYFTEKAITDINGETAMVDGKPTMLRIEGDRLMMEEAGGMGVYEQVDERYINLIHKGIRGLKAYREISEAEIGDWVLMGAYEQDKCVSNGPDPISWEVIDKKDGKLFLLCRSVIDDTPFNDSKDAVTWETCSLRAFLNGDFLDTVFSDDERAMIATTHLTNEGSADYLSTYWQMCGDGREVADAAGLAATSSGADTDDQVFVLSVNEILQYLGEADGWLPNFGDPAVEKDYIEGEISKGVSAEMGAYGRIAFASAMVRDESDVSYLKVQNGEMVYCTWVTRTMAHLPNAMIYVTARGAFYPYWTYTGQIGVRPAMWISVN